MKGNTASNFVKTEKAHLREMVESAVLGKTSCFKESFDKILHLKTLKLINREKNRLANMIFAESFVRTPTPTLKENLDADSKPDTSVMYDHMSVIDAKLYERESAHMPDWMQGATHEGIEIEPIREQDAIDLSQKFNSIEFTME